MGLYPTSIDSPTKATTYGPLPSHGFDKLALVLHTTETATMPGFNGGDVAPHYTYDPVSRIWTMWAEVEDGYVGTMKGHTTGGHGNCKAIQVEIIGYSDGTAAADPRRWVGNFTDQNYADLAAFYKWVMSRYRVPLNVTSTPQGGWTYGVNSPHRMSTSQWESFGGLTAHGAVPLNTHWDTGVLDLGRIANHIGGNMDDIGRNQLYIQQGQKGQDVEYWQNIIIQVGTGDLDTGNSNKAFFDAKAIPGLVFKEWNQAMTDYLSAWTHRNSWGVGATERRMLEDALFKLRLAAYRSEI